MRLTEIHRYPVKSMRSNALSESAVTPQGLPLDREWLVTTPDGTMLTARKFPKMLLWQAEADSDGLTLTAPDGSRQTISVHEMNQEGEVAVWKDRFQAFGTANDINTRLSGQLGVEARLHWLGRKSTRILAHSQTPLSFADGAPYLLTNTASLAELNTYLDEPVEMARFRPNLTVDGNTAFEEEQWRRIRIGEVEFEHFKPCVRCVMTTVDLSTGLRHPQHEPLSTLTVARNAVFGVNLIALNEGCIRAGDEVEVLAWR
ncbi:MOSC domain-containing protein [Neisseria sp. CCUG12390]|uniref:MOSC domain-containing protein n=1 Tax=Neisseria sp. CCUG12390 TaxID=3392035 RepID=UPI003A0FF856